MYSPKCSSRRDAISSSCCVNGASQAQEDRGVQLEVEMLSKQEWVLCLKKTH